ncbi:hypothetical protein MFUM_1020027 [Methylacidiphilum fumariolicum SolV]|uniref:Uncharacterized protein n=2 Tax=Candidatus Methylacidiphilum fumarolicum TaxID=591154 RepID=I0JVN5_METFB|nr:conserved protein of unknown function [Candidatus Methylacidiphilum fumarolicum]CCG91304.1 hypothetical protein MFUM_1020027 [Methylacidiphilum fumariolicum SolV]
MNALQLEASEVLPYKVLASVESGFVDLKSHLEVHPVYYNRPDQVRDYTWICLLDEEPT